MEERGSHLTYKIHSVYQHASKRLLLPAGFWRKKIDSGSARLRRNNSRRTRATARIALTCWIGQYAAACVRTFLRKIRACSVAPVFRGLKQSHRAEDSPVQTLCGLQKISLHNVDNFRCCFVAHLLQKRLKLALLQCRYQSGIIGCY